MQALLLSAWFRMLLYFVPIARLHPFLGDKGVESPRFALPVELLRRVGSISHRVNRVAQRTPWESKCFVQALVAQTLLKKLHLPSTLYLGVGKDEQGKMIAHAWIRCGEYYVTGGDGAAFAIVSKFTKTPRYNALEDINLLEKDTPEAER